MRKYCQHKDVDYQWLLRSRKEYYVQERPEEVRQLSGTAERLDVREIQPPAGRHAHKS